LVVPMATKFTYKMRSGGNWDVGSGTRLTQTNKITNNTDSLHFCCGKSDTSACVVSSPPGVHGPRAEDVGGGCGGAPACRLPLQHQRTAQRHRLRTGERRDREGSLFSSLFYIYVEDRGSALIEISIEN